MHETIETPDARAVEKLLAPPSEHGQALSLDGAGYIGLRKVAAFEKERLFALDG